ncbi:hypothetical protein AJ79_00644 [Helicocarpus griseus UAMH5409]|uniref:Arabinan endo-1,5-alpha-L-arabinosidase n=1 Tax=Helicocarpus griseus UAMH5409 TaxID=1447875 RepID=A0A2B7YAL9_9EURO|nr:hypothetical protein AJ79_00644 [Helicocarpus griseus UAMH5409]
MAAIMLLPALLFGGIAYAYAPPGGCTGACNLHDPALIQGDDGTYFRFSTGNRISYASAPSIEGPWTALGSVLPDGSSIDLPGNNDLWAPDVQKVNNAYHLYYTVSTFGTQNSAIGLATSPSLAPGTWTDRGSTGVTSDSSKPYNAIDGNLIATGDGAYQLSFGSFWNDIFIVAMNGDGTSTAEGVSSINIAYEPAGTHAIEGPYVYRYGDWWYLFFSAGICCGYDGERPAPGEEYRIKACRSDRVDGGYVDANGVDCMAGGGTVVLESHDNVYGPGGQGVYTDPDLGPILYYHYVDTNIGYADGQKLFGWNQIDFSSGWPVV